MAGFRKEGHIYKLHVILNTRITVLEPYITKVRSRLGVGFFFNLKFNNVLPCLIPIGSLWPWVTHLTGFAFL